jgi:hypothetical protein
MSGELRAVAGMPMHARSQSQPSISTMAALETAAGARNDLLSSTLAPGKHGPQVQVALPQPPQKYNTLGSANIPRRQIVHIACPNRP